MSGRVTIRLPARPGGRRRGSVDPEAAPAPTPERIPRVARVLALAHHWRGLIRSGAVRDQADLARLVGVSRARVTQVMSLLWLAPEIQDAILLAGGCTHVCDAQTEHCVRRIAAETLWHAQRRTWR